MMWNTKLAKLKRSAEHLEEARATLAKAAKDSQGHVDVSVSDPIAAAGARCDDALEALDRHIGAAVREELRNAPKDAVAS